MFATWVRHASMAGLCLAVLVGTAALGGCTPREQQLGPTVAPPMLQDDVLVATDGVRLPMAVWPASRRPRAVVVALHGYNMYRRYFDDPAAWWAEQGLTVYAYDQRGFGAAPEPGIWGGSEAMAADARAMLAAVRARHPDTPVYLLGCSMGAAVTLKALAGADAPAVDGAVLVAPAVWGGEALNPVFRMTMWLSAHLTPWNRATGGGLRRRPTDNVDILRRLGRDPLVIKYSRVDAVYGLTRLMGEGLAAAPDVKAPLLVLYGANDEIIPRGPVELMRSRLTVENEYIVYEDGWHMLLHDKQRERVWRDVADWLLARQQPAERRVAAD